ncbi:MAG TPA: 16S rRNA (guanine(966)-N(2))-methyltransferase RsmD, partial [Candidatus Omnitrophota bacterium]|nr:16S rRNA (guanine(966)-N(2))-methyltransferase RsmD [Candidatus Omnitrophota bacterium]
KGRRLAAPAGRVARPTADRTREALFNILAHSEHVELDGAVVVDCFAGSGGLGLEALSRGAADASFVESHPDSLKALTANIADLREGERATVLRCDATKLPPARMPCTLALLDAPYNSDLSAPCLLALARQGWLAPGALCVVEVAAKEAFTPPAGFTQVDERTYGAAKLVFLLAPES